MKNWLIISLLVTTAVASSCSSNKNEEAEELMKEIRSDYEAGNDSACLIAIDTLRHKYPKALELRKEALVMHQNIELRIAQRDLEKTDKELEDAKARYAELEKTVTAHKAELKATADELTALTLQRILRDSLQTRFEVLCGQIRYIHKKMKNEKAD